MNSRLLMAAQEIKERVSAQDVGQVMGLEIRNGRCRCPIHGGHDFNCRLYTGDRGFYCHVCKAGGDVLKLAQEYYDMSFKDTIAWFNGTFQLGLDIDGKIDQEKAREAEIALKTRKNARETAEWCEKAKVRMAMVADRILEGLEEARDLNVPKTPDEPWNDKFCGAVRMIPAARAFAERCMTDMVKEVKG